MKSAAARIETPSEENDPLMVPTREEWEQLSEEEQQETEDRIIAALEEESSMMGETTIHFQARVSADEVLRRFYKYKGRQVFIASDLHTLYPGERAFYPDLLVVFDVEDRHRRSWNVLREGKGLDFALEILSRETRRNDEVTKLNHYARLGIPEYFIYDPDHLAVRGYRLIEDCYELLPDDKRGVYSPTLGLRLAVDDFKLRFNSEGADLPFQDELIYSLNNKLRGKDKMILAYMDIIEEVTERAEKEAKRAVEADELVKIEAENAKKEAERAKKEAKRAAEADELVKIEAENAKKEAERAKKEAERAAEAESRVRELEEELKRLRGG